MWIVFACLSSLFAGATAILSKLGVKNTDSDVATALRTTVVLFLSILVTLITGEYKFIVNITTKSLVFLFLSGLATGASWICYFKALSMGEANKVAVIDKSSVILSILFALIIFPDERDNWRIKIVCLIAIALGTLLMIDYKKNDNSDGNNKKKYGWLLIAFLSAIFASLTSILAKIGIENVPSNLATSIRTIVVLIMSWLIVIFRRKIKLIKNIHKKDLLYLILSSFATAGSWLCYYYAISKGQVSVVVPFDKLSVLFTIVFSSLILKENIKSKTWVGLSLLLIGTILMAVC